MKRIRQIDRYLWRGSHPITDADFKELKDKGIKLIINLESGLWERFKGDVNYEVEKAIDYGFSFAPIHMSFFLPPKKHELKLILKLIKSYTDNQESVYFHCFSGVDRTGTVAATYRVMAQNWTIDDAIQEMLLEGHQWFLRWWDGITRKNLINLIKEH